MKTQIEYLNRLKEELKYLNPKDVKDVIKHYRDKISIRLDYGEDEGKVIDSLPSPSDVAREIYKKKGIDFINHQTKKMKRKDLFDKLTSLVAIIITTLAFIGIFLFLTILLFNKFKMVGFFLKNNLVEIVLNELFVLTYIVTSIIIIIFIIDLYLIIVSFFLLKFNYEISFSMRKLFDKITREKNILGKSLALSSLLVLIIGVLGFINKTYIYRVLTDYPQNEEIYYVTNSEAVEIINFISYEAKVKVLKSDDDRLKIKYQSEFNHQLKLVQSDNKLDIITTNASTYDLLNLLKEPVQIITVYLPQTKKIDFNIELTKGLISFNDCETNILNLKMQYGNVVLENVISEQLKAVFDSVQFTSVNNKYEIINFQITRGLIKTKDDNIKKLNIDNKAAGIGIENLTADIFNLVSETGTVVLDNLKSSFFDAELNASYFYLRNFSINNVKIVGNNNLIDFKNGEAESIYLKLTSGSLYAYQVNSSILLEDSSTKVDFNKIEGDMELQNLEETIRVFDSNLSNLTIVLYSKTLDLKKIDFIEGKITIIKGIGNFEEVYGNKISLHLDNTILNYTNTDSEKAPFDEFIQDYKNETVTSINGVNIKREG